MVQNLVDLLDWGTSVLSDESGRFRGGIDDGMQQLQQAAWQHGMPWSVINMSETLRVELESLIDSLRDPAVAKPPREGSVRWFIEKQHEPIAPGASVSVLQACYWTLYIRHYRGLNERGMDELCGVMSCGGLLPPQNLMPRCVGC